jgi:hypothetical protein
MAAKHPPELQLGHHDLSSKAAAIGGGPRDLGGKASAQVTMAAEHPSKDYSLAITPLAAKHLP